MEAAIIRRSQQELGIITNFKYIYKFKYQVPYRNIGAEHELCWVFIGRCNDPVRVNENEIAGWRFISAEDLEQEMQQNPNQFTPWFKLEWQCLTQNYYKELLALQVQLPKTGDS